MNVLVIGLRGLLAGCAIALIAYAAMCGLYLTDSAGIVNRPALIVRVVAVAAVSVLIVAWSIVTTRRMDRARKWATWIPTCLISAIALFGLYLYPVFFLDDFTDDKQLLREAAAAINASKGASEMPLPRGYAVQIERRPLAEKSVRLDVHLSNRVIAKVIGIDLIKVDNVAVEMRNGRIERAWVDYF